MTSTPKSLEKAFTKRLRNLDEGFKDLFSNHDDAYGQELEKKEKELKAAIDRIHNAIRTTEYELVSAQRFYNVPVTMRPVNTASTISVLKKHPEGYWCLYDSGGNRPLNCWDKRYKGKKPSDEVVQEAERIVQFWKNKGGSMDYNEMVDRLAREMIAGSHTPNSF